MQVLGQMLHRKVFTPIRKEVEGRKELEKRLNDRKKVAYTPSYSPPSRLRIEREPIAWGLLAPPPPTQTTTN